VIPYADMLAGAADDRGVASLAVIERSGAEPRTCWVPASDHEPAYLAYSITKTLTAALILQLCEAGAITLDDRLARWFPRIDRADCITIRQLLNHTAGVPDYGPLRAYHESVKATPESPWSFERFGEETFDRGLSFAPGHGWAYSNPGYMLLKRIAEEVSGASLATLVADRIARPLGLRRTFVAESIADLATLAPGTSCALSPDGAPRDVRMTYHPGWVSHGVVASTASDVARFLDALFRDVIVSRDAIAQMLELVPVPVDSSDAWRGGAPAYGLGLMGSASSRWGRIAGHNGGGPCYTASAFHAFDLGGATVCAIGAIERGFDAEGLAFDVLDRLDATMRASGSVLSAC
jgi:D-alanyl-D-alanine carboxypeptidase